MKRRGQDKRLWDEGKWDTHVGPASLERVVVDLLRLVILNPVPQAHASGGEQAWNNDQKTDELFIIPIIADRSSPPLPLIVNTRKPSGMLMIFQCRSNGRWLHQS
jgi:hypothetical protein